MMVGPITAFTMAVHDGWAVTALAMAQSMAVLSPSLNTACDGCNVIICSCGLIQAE